MGEVHPCGPMEDGTWMHCHWAGVAVSVCAGILLLFSALHLAIRKYRGKMVLDVLMILAAFAAAVIPGNLIQMCMMRTMRCWAVMRPGAIAFAGLTILAAVFDLAYQHRREKA